MTVARVPGVLWFSTAAPGGLEQQDLLPRVGPQPGAPHASWLRKTWVSLVRADGSGVKGAWEQEAKRNRRCVRHLAATAEQSGGPVCRDVCRKGQGEFSSHGPAQGKEGARGVFPSRAGAWEGNHRSQPLPSAYRPQRKQRSAGRRFPPFLNLQKYGVFPRVFTFVRVCVPLGISSGRVFASVPARRPR